MTELEYYRTKYKNEFLNQSNNIIRIKGKKFTLPILLRDGTYSTIGQSYTYSVVDFRCPIKGEYYVSGAVPECYKAHNTLTTEYLIVNIQKGNS